MAETYTIGIAGAGTMGASMAQSFAKCGCTVLLYDMLPKALEKAKALAELDQETEVAEGQLTEAESAALLGRIGYHQSMDALAGADFVIEAIREDMDTKKTFWQAVSALVGPACVLASNTSGLSISQMAAAVRDPGRFCGMHWINPAHIIPLVEVVQGEETRPEAAQAVYNLALLAGKKPVMVRDAPGFVLNRIQLAVIRECLHIAQAGIASMEDIDKVMKYALGLRYACLGPFEVVDLGGLDIFDSIAGYLFKDLGDEKESFYALREHVEKGEYGVKTGRGFYDYSGGKAEQAIRHRDEMYTKVARVLFEKE